jgi:nucleoside-diphosphate-sugar epimerase
MRTLIVGCGYVGLALGTELKRLGHEVFGVRRSTACRADFESAGIGLIAADLTRPETFEAFHGPFDWVVNLASAGQGGVEEYRQVYLTGTRNLLAWLRAAPPKKYVYTSSTGVYGQTDGSAVKEESEMVPPNETGVVLRQTEELVLAAVAEWKCPAVILRLAGIYGPGRGHYFRQFLAGTAKIEGDGLRHINMIHLDDVVGVILDVLKSGRPGDVFNAVDDEPVTQLYFFRWLAESLGKDLPPFDPTATQAERKRGWTNKKVLNRKLKMQLGYRFRYPTFRQGYTAEIQRLDALP